jgi:hypothetical protein
MVERGMSDEIVARSGTWSEVLRVREDREEEGKEEFQALLIRTLSSLISVGESLQLDQV